MTAQILNQESEQWLVLTPQSKFEEEVLKLFEDFPNVYRGEFTQCRGGYMRSWDSSLGYDRDLIIKFAKKKTNNE